MSKSSKDEYDDLLDKAAEAVRRDLNHIFMAVSTGKLDAASSRDLVAYYKLLSEAQKSQEGLEERILAEAKKLIGK